MLVTCQGMRTSDHGTSDKQMIENNDPIAEFKSLTTGLGVENLVAILDTLEIL